MTINKLLALLAVIVFAVVAVIDIATQNAVPHELGWIAVGLALFAASFLP